MPRTKTVLFSVFNRGGYTDCVNMHKSAISEKDALDIMKRAEKSMRDNHGPHFGCGSLEIARYKNEHIISRPNTTKPSWIYRNYLEVDINYNKDSGCSHCGKPKECMAAIKNGTCTDKFVRTLFCETVFKRNNKKQR